MNFYAYKTCTSSCYTKPESDYPLMNYSKNKDGWELKAVAACVIGGTSLRGGIGSMTGIFLGAVIISVIENGLVVLRIPYFWTYVVFGLVILFSVLSSMYVERKLMETHQ